MEYKSRSLSKRKKTQRRPSAGSTIVVMVSILLIAGIIVLSPLGSILSESVIQPIMSCFKKNPEDEKIVAALQSHDEKKADPTPAPTKQIPEKAVLTIEETPFYILQMGVFTDRDEANRHGEEIALFGAGGEVFHDGSVYRVFAAAYLDEESVLKVQSQVRADGYEATPYVTDRSGFKVTLEGNREAITIVNDSIPLLSSVPTELSKMSLDYDKNNLSEAEIKNKLNKLNEVLKESILNLKLIQSDPVWKIVELLQKYQQSISTFLREHDTIKMKSSDLKSLQLSTIIDYILFFQQE